MNDEITLKDLGLPANCMYAIDRCVTKPGRFPDDLMSGPWIGERPINALLPHLNLNDLLKERGVGMTGIANFREKLKKLGYNHSNCPFLLQGTKTEARQNLQKELARDRLSKKEFELIWKVAVKHFRLCVPFLYDE